MAKLGEPTHTAAMTAALAALRVDAMKGKGEGRADFAIIMALASLRQQSESEVR